jgi:hypothetical protein
MEIPQSVDSPIPAVLLRCPRGVRRKPGTLVPLLIGRILTAPLLVACVGLLAVAIVDPIVVFLVPAQAAHINRMWMVSEGRRGTTDHIEYQFDQSGFVGSDEVLPAEFAALQVGQAVRGHVIHLGPVGYSALDRSAGAYARNRRILWFVTGFALAMSAVLFYALWLVPWRSRWLTRHGKATFGAVVEKSIISHGNRRHFYFTLTYQFKALGELKRKQIRISPQRFDSAGVKDLVIILFDPKRPGRNIVYDYCDFLAT